MFTGLTKEIGQPREYEKNVLDPSYFDKNIDINIPQDETNELHSHFSRRAELSDQKTTSTILADSPENSSVSNPK